MTTIEYKGTKIEVPTTWRDITLGFYDTFFYEAPETKREKIALIAKVCRVDIDLLMSWPAEIFNIIIGQMEFLFGDLGSEPRPYIEIRGKKYVVNFEEKLTLGEWIDVDEAIKSKENVLSSVLAVICRPLGEEYKYTPELELERRTLFQNLTVEEVRPVLAFFLTYESALKRLFRVSLEIEKAREYLRKSTGNLRAIGVGTKLLRIWRVMMYYVLRRLLVYRLDRLSLSFNTREIKRSRKRLKGNSKKNSTRVKTREGAANE